MKKLTFILMAFYLTVGMQVFAQQKEKSNKERQEQSESLSKEQKETIGSILLNYDSASLTAEDAKAIHKAFRDAGLRGGPAANDVIRQAGFDPDKLRDLAPPPDMQEREQITDRSSSRHTSTSGMQTNEFTVSSSALKPDGSLLLDYTGDGRGVSMPLEWTNVPEGTKYFALNLWHLPHPSDTTEVKSYWLVYNIPANVQSLPEDVKGIGKMGYNDKDNNNYDPMKSKGPGVKEYNLTIYALSAKPKFNTSKVYRADLLKAIKGITLDECTLTYTYERGKNIAPKQ